ncbi:MAG: serine/threonine protein kinase, partial [Anaerolineaceae bacterium]|nr:serine/threonine protein kinase [Anaerolineaceae bacterium]
MNNKSPQQYCISCGMLYPPRAGDTGLCPECASSIVQSSPVVAVRSQTSPSEPVSSEIWQAGQTLLDTYEVKGKLGEGGMGIVYRVHHNAWNLDLALKQPKAEVVAKAGVENFVNEAQAWVDLGLHPHITTCHYVRNIEELPCVFAELVEGGSLAEWIEQGKLRKLDDILDVSIQFAWGLHYAHELGMIHQDVKPDNVLIKEDGTAKVTDFGLVKVQTKGPMSISGKGTVLAEWGGGTKAYFSPEQSAAADLSNQAWQWAEAGEKELSDKLRQQIGQLPKPTRRTDLWSWAVSVLEMFNGE